MPIRKVKKLTSNVRCMQCGCEFNEQEIHPPYLEFVNDCPSPCINIGMSPFGIGNKNTLPWVKRVVRDGWEFYLKSRQESE